ncbi:MAG: molybdate ABC transporter substrate-binding protein [Pseudomonadota bacterium]
MVIRLRGTALALCVGITWLPARADDVTVFAAASLTDALTEVSAVFEEETGHSVDVVFASSSTLARQIESGAPADVFISASPAWMDYLDDQGLIDPPTRRDLLVNTLVLIAPSDQAEPLDLPEQLPEALGPDGRLAIGDPDHVPAGIFAAEALLSLGLWDALADRTARTGSVRAALALVERGEAPLGIVYATDAEITDRVAIVATFPEDSHQPIVYPVAQVAEPGTPAGDRVVQTYLRYLAGDDAAEVFRDHGFLTVNRIP